MRNLVGSIWCLHRTCSALAMQFLILVISLKHNEVGMHSVSRNVNQNFILDSGIWTWSERVYSLTLACAFAWSLHSVSAEQVLSLYDTLWVEKHTVRLILLKVTINLNSCYVPAIPNQLRDQSQRITKHITNWMQANRVSHKTIRKWIKRFFFFKI